MRMPQETQPAHEILDLQNQSSVFIALEELGIAHMQHVWLSKHHPTHEDGPAIAQQAQEFFEDFVAILLGKTDATRVKPNSWAGDPVADHLAVALGLEVADNESVVREALTHYLNDLTLLTERDAELQAKGEKLPPKEYIDFMAGWSALFSGAQQQLVLPEAFILFKASRGNPTHSAH